MPAKAADLSHADGRDERLVAKRLAGVDVREVHLHRGEPHTDDRVPQCDTGVGVGPRVDEDAVGPSPGLVQRVYEHTLVVGLHDAQLHTALARSLAQRRVDLVQRHAAVGLRLPPPQQVEVGAV